VNELTQTQQVEMSGAEVDKTVEEILRQLGLVSTEEALGQAVQNLTDVDEEKIKLLTDVNVFEINQIALMLTIAKRYNIGWLKDFVREVLKLRVSANRLGRREIVRMITGMEVREHAGVRGWLAKKFGKGKKKEEAAVTYAAF